MGLGFLKKVGIISLLAVGLSASVAQASALKEISCSKFSRQLVNICWIAVSKD